MVQALPEICGISVFLKETHRALKKDGFFIIKVTELPFNEAKIPLSEYVRFAEKTDLYAGYEKFLADAENCGLRIEESKRFTGVSGRLVRLITFSK